MNVEELLNYAAAALRLASRFAEQAALIAGGHPIDRADLETARDKTRELLGELERRAGKGVRPVDDGGGR